MTEKPLVSFIILSDRPDRLPILLHALRAQTDSRWEALVLDQSENGAPECIAKSFCDPRIQVARVGRVGDWGQTVKANAIQLMRGEFVAFPNDDAYYVPTYVRSMTALAFAHSVDLVYCDWLFDLPGYIHMDCAPQVGRIDVGGFIVRRSVFDGIEWADRGQTGDGKLVESIVAAGYPHGKAPGVLYVKN